MKRGKGRRMRPFYHAVTSLILIMVVAIFIRPSPVDIPLWILLGVTFGTLIDLDHGLYALILNRKLTFSLLRGFSIRKIYDEIMSPEGRLFLRIEKALAVYAILHTTSLAAIIWVGFLYLNSFLVPIGTGALGHYISDFATVVVPFLHRKADVERWRRSG